MKNKQGLALAFAIAFGLASIPNMVTINAEEAQVSTSNGGETIPVDAQHFPDSEFLRYVKHNYMDENGNLSEKAVNEDDLVLNTFTTGSIHVDVKDLEGVAYFPNIERITYVNSKTFQTVDLSKNTNLTCIVFYNDKIDSIKFADNNRIVTLNLYQNELKGLDVSNFKNLETLIIAENPLLYLNVGEQTINFLRYEKNKPVDIVTTDGTIDLEKEAPGITASKIKYTSKDGVKLDGTKFSGVTKDMVIHYDYQITENDVLPVTINVIYKAPTEDNSKVNEPANTVDLDKKDTPHKAEVPSISDTSNVPKTTDQQDKAKTDVIKDTAVSYSINQPVKGLLATFVMLAGGVAVIEKKKNNQK